MHAGCAGTVFVWVGDDSRTMPNLSASSSNKYVRALLAARLSNLRCLAGCSNTQLTAVLRPQSPMPAVSTLMTAAADQSSVPSERAEAFSQHLGQSLLRPRPAPYPALQASSYFPEPSSCLVTAKKLPNVMVLGSYQLPAEPAILHEVAAREVLKRLQPLLEDAA